MQTATMEMMKSSKPLGLKSITVYRLQWVNRRCDDDTFTCQVHCPVTILCWLMPTHSKLCKSNSVPSCIVVLLYVCSGSSAHNSAIWPWSRNLSSKWQLGLLDNQSNYFQQRVTVRFLRQCLYALSPRCMSAMLVKAETQAVKVDGPYGTDGLTHSPLNPVCPY